jgi:hypothetical protein
MSQARRLRRGRYLHDESNKAPESEASKSPKSESSKAPKERRGLHELSKSSKYD